MGSSAVFLGFYLAMDTRLSGGVDRSGFSGRLVGWVAGRNILLCPSGDVSSVDTASVVLLPLNMDGIIFDVVNLLGCLAFVKYPKT